MSKLFSLDSGLYKFMSRLFDMLKLNAMWILCSIPIVTIGASTTAAFTITLKMVDEEEGYIAGPNLFKGSAIGLIQLFATYAIYLDFQLARVSERYGTLCTVVGVIAIVMTVMHFLYAYALLARYENTIVNTLRNSYSICVKSNICSYSMVQIILHIGSSVNNNLYLVFYQLHWTLLFFGIILGPACFILTISGFARQFFRNIERENDLREEESKQEKANERQGIWKEAFEDQEESDPK